MTRKVAFVGMWLVMALVALGCGGSEATESVVAADTGSESASDAAPTADDGDEDHGDDDHGDDDHGDADGDEDHGDEDHDDRDHDDEGTSAGLGAHEHGSAELLVAVAGSDVVIDLVSPAFNIIGFEYEPASDDDIAQAETQIDRLRATGIIEINAEAGCEQVGDLMIEQEYDGSHAEITGSWFFSCDAADQITRLDATELFAEFPNLEDVDAQWVSDSGQSAAELSPASPVLRFE